MRLPLLPGMSVSLKRCLWVGLIGTLGAESAIALAPGEPNPTAFERCLREHSRDRRDGGYAICFVQESRRINAPSQARKLLEALSQAEPDSPWPHYALAAFNPDADAYVATIRRAIQLSSQDEWTWVPYAEDSSEVELQFRIDLHQFLIERDRWTEAERAYASSRARCRELAKPVFEAVFMIRHADSLLFRMERLGEAYDMLEEAQAVLLSSPKGEAFLYELHGVRGNMAAKLGRYQEALHHRLKAQEIADGTELQDVQAIAYYNTASTYINLFGVRSDARAQALDLLERALKAAKKGGIASIAIGSSLQLGKLKSGQESLRHFEECLDLAANVQEKRYRSDCLGGLAQHYMDSDPERSSQLVQETLRLNEQFEDRFSLAYALSNKMRLSWKTRGREEAIRDSLEVLKFIERLRLLQTAEAARAGLFSVWSGTYYWLSGRLLADPGDSRRRSVELAFSVAERMRSRVLSERLHDSRLRAAPRELQDRLRSIQREIVQVQRSLLRSQADDPGRVKAEDRRSRLENEERQLQRRIESASEEPLKAYAPDVGILGRVEAQLNENQALLSFLLELDSNIYGNAEGGSWLLVSTGRGTKAYRLADEARLQANIATALDLLKSCRPQDGERCPIEELAASLYRDLLAEALSDLDPAIDHLIVVPDQILHLLPLSMLRPGPEEQPLAMRYRFSMIPSATLWLHWKSTPIEEPSRPALVFADPEPPSPEGWRVSPRRILPPLIHSRREGRDAVRNLGRGTELLTRTEANESALHRQPLKSYSLLHFAAHAWIDDSFPQRSAVMLAAAQDQDGMLQPREIVSFDLQGRTVVLAGCRSAGGRLVRGEGVMSLARAFFQARAHAVVGALWPLEDRDAARLFRHFYSFIGQGSSVSEALASAQRIRIREGAPPQSWAGVVVLGDGDVLPLPEGRASSLDWRTGAASMLLVFAVAWALWLGRLR